MNILWKSITSSLEMNDNLSWSWQCNYFFLQNHYNIMDLISHPNIQAENKSKSAYHKHCILIRTLLNLLHFSIGITLFSKWHQHHFFLQATRIIFSLMKICLITQSNAKIVPEVLKYCISKIIFINLPVLCIPIPSLHKCVLRMK